MKALTIWQPWASLIAAGAKPYEFRGWRPPRSIIGQRIAIHAGARKQQQSEVSYLAFRCSTAERASRSAIIPDKALPVLERWRDLPMSAIVCTAILGEPVDGATAAESMGAALNDSEREGTFNWGWPLTDIIPEPAIPARGRQGFWDWEGG